MRNAGIMTLNAFSAELLFESELSNNGVLLLNYLNPTLFVEMLNNDDNPTLTEAINGLGSTGFMVAMETKFKH